MSPQVLGLWSLRALHCVLQILPRGHRMASTHLSITPSVVGSTMKHFLRITHSNSHLPQSFWPPREKRLSEGAAAPGPRQGPIRHYRKISGEMSWVDVGSGGKSVLALVPTGLGQVWGIGDGVMFLGF